MDLPLEGASPKHPLTRAHKAPCCAARTNIGSLPVELQAKVFDTHVWLGPERRNAMPVDEAKVRMERLLTIRLVSSGLAACYFGDMARIKFQLHMRKRSKERDEDPNKNQMLRSIFYRCSEAADLAAVAAARGRGPISPRYRVKHDHDKHDIFPARMRRKGFPRVIALAATMGDGARRWPPRRQRGIRARARQASAPISACTELQPARE